MAATTDDFGNTTGSWSDHLTRSAHIIERTGNESTEGGALADVSTATLRVRKDTLTAALSAADRVVARGQTWAIRSVVQVDNKGQTLEFLLEKGVAS
jgi:head-tail adaptor